LIEKYPSFQKLSSLRIAVNEEYAEDHTEIKETDEIVLIPPVSGG
jgi:molybdopterin synthase sulfur carrier subunit